MQGAEAWHEGLRTAGHASLIQKIHTQVFRNAAQAAVGSCALNVPIARDHLVRKERFTEGVQAPVPLRRSVPGQGCSGRTAR